MKSRLQSWKQQISTGNAGWPFKRAGSERGIALILTIFIVFILAILSIVMVLSVNSDMFVNGYYSNYRGALYAADAGLSIARADANAQLTTGVQALLSTTACNGWGASGTVPSPSCGTSSPLTTAQANAVASAVQSYITTHYKSYNAINTGAASKSWPAQYLLPNSTKCPTSIAYDAATGPVAHAGKCAGQYTSYTYRFNYSLCTTGTGAGSGSSARQLVQSTESGAFVVSVAVTPTVLSCSSVPLSVYAAFINSWPAASTGKSSGWLIPGTYSGPMFTNGTWQFGTGGKYIFTDTIMQAGPKFDFWFGSHYDEIAAGSDTYKGQTIAPTFMEGYELGTATASLPANSYSQAWAALDGYGCGEPGNACGSSTPSQPSTSDPNNGNKNDFNYTDSTATPPVSVHMQTVNGSVYNGSSNGVYLNYTGTTLNGGGFYVQGNAAVLLSTGTDGSGNPTQVYTITQGITTTTITTNATANTTTVTSGGTTKVLSGVPTNKLTNSAATMLYVNGKVTSLSGPGEGQAAIQDGTALTITAAGDVDVTGDIRYKTEPVTQDVNDTLISGNDKGQVLGIFTATGNIQLSSPYADKNLQVDGSLAALSSSCGSSSCGFTVSGSINTFNNVGGQIQFNIFSASMKTANTYFDRRFLNNGFAPPWFPSTNIPPAGVGSAPTASSSPQRLSWVTTPQ